MVLPRSLWSFAISTRIWTRSSASRFDSGSSNRKIRGSRTMARPMATRWRWPPESWRGLRFEQRLDLEDVGAPSARAGDLGARHARRLEAEGEVLVDGHMRVERVGLEHHRNAAPAAGTSFMRWPSISRSPPVIGSSPAIMRSSVDLPQPEGPTKHRELARVDGRGRCRG